MVWRVFLMLKRGCDAKDGFFFRSEGEKEDLFRLSPLWYG